MPNTQTSFRPYRSYIDQVLSLTTYIDVGHQDKLKLGVAFIDFNTVFDTVWRKGMLSKLLSDTVST